MTPNDLGLIADLPEPTLESQPFWDGCNAERIMLQHCMACNRPFFYARRLCPACGSSELQWQPASGRATVYSFSEVHVAFSGEHWASQLPYTVVLVDLDEGPRMLSRWHSKDGQPPSVGERATVMFPEFNGQKLPFFEPIGGDLK